MVEAFGFRWSCTGLGALLVVVCIGIAPCLYHRRFIGRSGRLPLVHASDERSSALLDSVQDTQPSHHVSGSSSREPREGAPP